MLRKNRVFLLELLSREARYPEEVRFRYVRLPLPDRHILNISDRLGEGHQFLLIDDAAAG